MRLRFVRAKAIVAAALGIALFGLSASGAQAQQTSPWPTSRDRES